MRSVQAPLETVDLDSSLGNSFFDEEGTNLLSLISLELDDLAEFFVFD